MLDQTAPGSGQAAENPLESYDLVVVGAGVAGLNALNAATEYLPKGAKALLIDQKDAAGGMWNVAYDYVRLHQPHPMFTVGNMKWAWAKPRSYLAARDEVQRHLASAMARISRALEVETQFGSTVVACEEIDTDAGPRARVRFHPSGAPDAETQVLAKRAVFATALNYRTATPLGFTSDAVVSIIPQDLRSTLAAHPGAPVIVVGGGKTGMDTVLAVLAEDAARDVTLIKGRGTNFINRSRFLPTGLERWTSGQLTSQLFRGVAENFNGDNEDQTLAHVRRALSTDPETNNGVFLYGLQSEDELARVKAGLKEDRFGYLDDIIATPDGPVAQLRDGARFPVDEGTIVVNCTGSFFREGDLTEAMPMLSPKQTIISITPRDTFHFLTSVSGFFMVHLVYRDALRGQGFYTVDHEGLFRANRNAWVGATAAQAYLNQVVAVQTLPLTLLDRCGLDLDRWYPLPRRVAGLIRMKANAKADIPRCQATLDRVAERFGVMCREIV